MKRLIVAAVVAAAIIFLVVDPGAMVVDHPEKSDVIVVLGGDSNDVRYWRGIELLRAGYGHQMIVDAGSQLMYGRTVAEHAADFVARTAGELAPQITVCTIKNDSTLLEAGDLGGCLARLQPTPRMALLVTSDYHTRRALSIISKRLPQYRWSAAAARDDYVFGQPWWTRREWAKINCVMWKKSLTI